jgi:hypothetical protein
MFVIGVVLVYLFGRDPKAEGYSQYDTPHRELDLDRF